MSAAIIQSASKQLGIGPKTFVIRAIHLAVFLICFTFTWLTNIQYYIYDTSEVSDAVSLHIIYSKITVNKLWKQDLLKNFSR